MSLRDNSKKFLQSRLTGFIWLIWGLFAGFTALMMPWVMSDSINYSPLLPYVTAFWGIAAIIHLGCGPYLVGKPLKDSVDDSLKRAKYGRVSLIIFILQLMTSPFIPWV